MNRHFIRCNKKKENFISSMYSEILYIFIIQIRYELKTFCGFGFVDRVCVHWVHYRCFVCVKGGQLYEKGKCLGLRSAS